MIRSLNKDELHRLFADIDSALRSPMTITVLGGAAIVLAEYRDRTTIDIDIAPQHDAQRFAASCKTRGIPTDIIAMTNTVDLTHCDRVLCYEGTQLTIYRINAEDLIRSKLERYQKHDADDIAAIIEREHIAYRDFEDIVRDMLTIFIGNPTPLRLSARDLVERHYAEHLETFDQTFAR